MYDDKLQIYLVIRQWPLMAQSGRSKHRLRPVRACYEIAMISSS